MKKIRFQFAILMGKLANVCLKLVGKKIPYYPGYVAMKVCPSFLSMVERPKKVIAITGTNGKSTISALLTDFFEKQGYKTMNNNGFNIETGISSMYIKNITLFGKLKADISIMEIGENSLENIFKSIKPDYLVCTNLFRDSMHSNGNVDYILNKIKKGIPNSTKLIINADDLILCQIVNKNKVIYYGINKYVGDKKKVNNLVCDLVYCPKCGGKLEYNLVRYHHIGNIKCSKCGYGNPKSDYSGNINNKLEVEHNGKVEKYSLISKSIFNIYNELAVITLLRELKYDEKIIEEQLSLINIIDSRYTECVINNIKLVTHMAKGQNPVACSSVFEYVKKQKGKKVVLLMLDDVTDKRYSSETVAWHYDTDYEFLNNDSIEQIIVGGVRSKDVLIRLLLSGIDKKKITIVNDEYQMYKKIKLKNIDSIYLLHDINACDQSLEIKKQIIEYIKESAK